MSTPRLAATELRRITAGRLPKLAVLALVLVPLLYGSLYLYANADPYKRLDKIPAALVMADTGVNGEPPVGRKVADKLRSSGAFDWHEVSAADAEAGVRDNRYTFSLTLPPDFSAALVSSGQFQPRQGLLTVTTNDANNYLVRTIADKVVSEVRKSIAEEVGEQAAEKFLIGFNTIYDKTRQAADGATQLASGSDELLGGQRKLADGARQLADGATQAATGAGQLSGGLNTLRDKTKDLPAQTAALADGARQVAAGNERIAQTGEQVAGAAQEFVSHVDELDARMVQALRDALVPEYRIQQIMAEVRQVRAPIDTANGKVQGVAKDLRTLANGAKQVADGNTALANGMPALAGGIAQAADGAGQLATGTAQLRDGAVQLRDGENTAVAGTEKLAGGAHQLSDGLTQGLNQIPHPDDATRDATARTIADPVAIRQAGQVTAPSYGAGLAPFFLGLATWIGAFVLFLLVRPLSARALAAGHNALRTALAGWLPPMLLGLAQVTLLFTVVTLVVGIHPAHPIGTLAFLALTSMAFVAIVQMLNAVLGSVGKFLALVMLILQLISAGGTFPWQTLPDPLYPLHRVLPLGYVVDGLRGLLYGGSLPNLWLDVAVLAAYLLGALALTAFAARRHRVWTPSRLKPELAL